MNRMAAYAACALMSATSISAQVSFERLLHAAREPGNWLTFHGNLAGTRYSPLEQIKPLNVGESRSQMDLPGASRWKSTKPRRWWWTA